MTFHQSFSYEEFIEGLRPVIQNNESGIVKYEIRDGILKNIALRAREARIESEPNPDLDFDSLWEKFRKQYEDNPTKMLQGLNAKNCFKVGFQPHQVSGTDISGRNQIGQYAMKEQIKWVFERIPVNERPDPHTILKAAGPTRKDTYERKTALIGAILWELWRIAKRQSGEGNEGQAPQPVPRYVLIIDEINRGNISKILGELITLLEDDKRIGEENELRLSLPTSGKTFALPPNLYILGTMNTSDKSLAQLDVALRRRFDFEELTPNLALCNGFAAQIPILQELNNRLEWALDREHRLGHAYFMKVDSEDAFNAVFRTKILPLLLEYFPHDFATLRAVLGEKSDGFLREMTKPEGFTSGGKKYRWWFESGVKDFSAFAQLKTNYGL